MKAEPDPDDGHLDELALDALRAGEGTPENVAHVEHCQRCRAAVVELARLEARLKEAQPGTPAVPVMIEAQIFQGYRKSLGTPAPVPIPTLIRRWTLPAAGLAAAVAAVTLTLRLAPPDESRRTFHEPARVLQAPASPAALEAPQIAAAVDIVDAFRLARALRDGRPVPPRSDADGDGVVGAADVQALARRAVAL